ncbi:MULTISPECIES: periplasmic nitrate reductase, NapE protein [unclassified Moritella]|uniref:periplasmic nitrate reductase, NapE protein n=1 Tax=unclassified Moritella TaxID=2637987 RepID=UPI001BA95E58|nr:MULTISPECIES: periplasmic nitrate reductase, NapE protein [unclassified Moritella]QUM86879.1 periplasmic nitrate reductase, NapE protein [Moritella sp. 28]QUM91103.1 periplasmic nitrate reductase, NapE protein [Moritella sp. 36]
MKQQASNVEVKKVEKKAEWKLFVFLTVFLFPILATVSVFGYGFVIWMSHILFGLPSH